MKSNTLMERELSLIHCNQNIKSEAAKLLDSSTVSVSALGATAEPRNSEEIPLVSSPQKAEWHYLLLKNKELLIYNEYLSGPESPYSFPTFIYTAVEHRKRIENCRYTEEEYQTRVAAASQAIADIESGTHTGSATSRPVHPISGGGYLFVLAPFDHLKQALTLMQPHRYLVTDYATGKAARIPNKQMEDFIYMYETMPWNIRVLERPISDYAKSRQPIRITGGVLRGAEGFIVRINRDRHLVFSFGSMTLAVSGIHAFPFEPA